MIRPGLSHVCNAPDLCYRPYGETRYNSGSRPPTFRFTGQRSEEAGTGLPAWSADRPVAIQQGGTLYYLLATVGRRIPIFPFYIGRQVIMMYNRRSDCWRAT
jgi:hypothetical protein